ncbi:hypothetical protein [Nocardia brasiliensis]|uniref:hypothetical protein n=1 Tax=Nocardia brasiliensis TaxID=37326 RepID=UPI0004A760BE|nr:hypothetical protein [Nocardia brasiliensis]
MVAVLLGLADGVSNGVIMTVGADAAPDGRRAEFLGAWRLTHDVGMFAGPLVAGAMYRWFPGHNGVRVQPLPVDP